MAHDASLGNARRTLEGALRTQPSLAADNRRPCATALDGRHVCTNDVTAEPGAVRCTDGHTTVGLESGPSRRGGTHAPTTIATWVAAVGPSGKCFRVVLTRRDNGSLRAAYLPWKVVPSVRYGAEPLGERAIVFTEHAVAEAQDEDITKDDIVHVFRTGTMTRVQPGLVRRIEGRDASGRTVVVCYRLNKRHEVVIITTFLNSELVGLSA